MHEIISKSVKLCYNITNDNKKMRLNENKNQKKTLSIILSAALAGFLLFGSISAIAAPPPGATTTPYTISYSARLTNSIGNPVTTARQVRFSLWSDADVDPTDFLGSGAINPLAGGFSGWQETHSVTPDADGLFHVQLGSITPHPNFTIPTHIYLQVDVKANAAPDTSYETLDPDGNNGNLTDRPPINSVPFAINSDTVDNRDVGYAAGQIPYLDLSALLPISTIPGGTNQDSFIIDFDDSVAAPGTIALQFGSALARVLEYDIAGGYFHFNDDVRISGGLAATGNVDFSLATEFHMREVADEAAATCTTIDEMVLDTAENKIYICTAPGSPGTWTAISGGGGGTYSQTKVFEAEYNDSVYVPDGTNNKGTLSLSQADTDGAPGNNNFNYYVWQTLQPAMQDMDIVIRTHIPEGFTGWQAVPVNFSYNTLNNNVLNNSLDIIIEDTAGNPVPLVGATGLASAAWTTSAITFGGAPVWTPGQPITIYIKLSADNTGIAHAGRLSLNYAGL